jgi:hypothetical protein
MNIHLNNEGQEYKTNHVKKELVKLFFKVKHRD